MTVDIRPSATDRDVVSNFTQDASSADGILLAEGRFQEALAPLRLALALGDALPSTLLNLAIAEDRAGSRDHARRLMWPRGSQAASLGRAARAPRRKPARRGAKPRRPRKPTGGPSNSTPNAAKR